MLWIDGIEETGLRGWLASTVQEIPEGLSLQVNGNEATFILDRRSRPDVSAALGLNEPAAGIFIQPPQLDWLSRGVLKVDLCIKGRKVGLLDESMGALLARLATDYWAATGVELETLIRQAEEASSHLLSLVKVNVPADRDTDPLRWKMFGVTKSVPQRPDLRLSAFQWHMYTRHCREHPSFRGTRHFTINSRAGLRQFLSWSLKSFGDNSAGNQLPVGDSDMAELNVAIPGTGFWSGGSRIETVGNERYQVSVLSGPSSAHFEIPLTGAQAEVARNTRGSVIFDHEHDLADFLLAWIGSWGVGHRGWWLLTDEQQRFLLEPSASIEAPLGFRLFPISRFALARLRESRDYRVYGSDLHLLQVRLAFLVHLLLNEIVHAGTVALVDEPLNELASLFGGDEVSDDLVGRVSQLARRVEALILTAPEPGSRPDVTVVGMLDSKSGLGANARNSVRVLESRGFAVRQHSVNLHDRSVQQVLRQPPFIPGDINLIHVNPDNLPELVWAVGPGAFSKSYNIGFFAWELDLHPDAHMLALELVDEVWVPSEYCATSFRRYTSKPVVVMPHFVEDARRLGSGLSRADLGLDEDLFVVHSSFDVHSWPQRKNPLGSIQAFQVAFSDDRARLLMKVRNGRNIGKVDSDRDGVGEAILEAASADPRIILDFEERSYSETQDLIAMSDCFLSLHRSEGFGYALAESLLLGVPLITADNTGSAEFCKSEWAWLVPCQSRYVSEGEYYLAPGGARWSEPDVDIAAELLRLVRQGGVRVRRKAEVGQAFVARKLSADAMADAYTDRITALHASPMMGRKEAK